MHVKRVKFQFCCRLVVCILIMVAAATILLFSDIEYYTIFFREFFNSRPCFLLWTRGRVVLFIWRDDYYICPFFAVMRFSCSELLRFPKSLYRIWWLSGTSYLTVRSALLYNTNYSKIPDWKPVEVFESPGSKVNGGRRFSPENIKN